MGLCCCSMNDPISKTVTKGMKNKRETSQKLLLLGSGGSGKSTLFKQLKAIHNVSEILDVSDLTRPNDDNGYRGQEYDKITLLSNIRHSCIASIIKLLEKSHEFYSVGINDCYVEVNDLSIQKMIRHIKKHEATIWTEFEEIQAISPEELRLLGESIEKMWQLDAIREHTFKRRNIFSFDDSAIYFFNKSSEIFDATYEPSFDDYLRVRVRTIGMNQIQYTVQDSRFHIIDVGGQRCERRKWLQYFDQEQVRAVIFVAALNAYYNVLFEDETKNAMHESIEVFKFVINHRAFLRQDFILMLNKNDLFQQNILNGISLNECFSVEKNWTGPVWDGPDYKPRSGIDEDKLNGQETDSNIVLVAGDRKRSLVKDDITLLNGSNQNTSEDVNAMKMVQVLTNNDLVNAQNQEHLKDQYFIHCYTAAINFIHQAYVSQRTANNDVYVHITTATDRNIIERVFQNVQKLVIRSNLQHAGVLMHY